jgi:hypothetical protein
MALKKVENITVTIQSKNNERSIIKREKKMVKIMVRIYCNAKHKTNGPPYLKCNEFLEYVLVRLDKFPYHVEKTTCGKCGLSCYESRKKEMDLEIFYFSGPRMLIRHPVLTFHHLFDEFRELNRLDY